jgi:hypothetical protein
MVLNIDELSRFINCRAFRSRMCYDLASSREISLTSAISQECSHDTKNQATSSNYLFSNTSDYPGFFMKYFPLMDLPVELRIMITKYALYVPEGLVWKWINYRRGCRVATLKRRRDRKRLEWVNALAGTCKQLYQETQGLVLS